MRDIDYDNITAVVLRAYSGADDERTRELLAALVRHLHEFVREVRLTPKEWESVMGVLLRAGQASSEQRNEFILLSDLLGVSALVDLEDGRDDEGASISTLMGPFYVPGQPEIVHSWTTSPSRLVRYAVVPLRGANRMQSSSCLLARGNSLS